MAITNIDYIPMERFFMKSNSAILYLLLAVALVILISGIYNVAVNNTASVVQILALTGLGALIIVALLGYTVNYFTTRK